MQSNLTCLIDELKRSSETSQLHRAEIAQPLSTAVQIAIFNYLVRCGIRPTAVVGHSSGEIAAAYAAGALSLSDAIKIAYYRGYVTKKQQLRGGMAVVGLSATTVSQYLMKGLVVTCRNSPSSTTVSGDLEQLGKFLQTIQTDNPKVLARRLKVDIAYHSRECHNSVAGYS